jgi:hypothetical protein
MQSQPSNFATYRVKGRKDDGLGGVINNDLNTGGSF